MLTLAQIMTADPVTIGPETTLREAIELLSRRRISGVPVVSDGGRILGVVSASDILAHAASLPGVPRDPEDRNLNPAEGGDEADPYTESFAGYWDDVGADVVSRMHSAVQPEWDRLDEHTVDEVMTRRLYSLPPTADLVEAARHMMEAGIHRLLVVDGDQLVGLASAMDFVKAVAGRRLLT